MDTVHEPPVERSSRSAIERRRETRRLVGGEVILAFEDPQRMEVQSCLVDLSAGGFRAAHQCLALRPGQVVSFRHAWATGKARVMWNRVISDSRVESGLFILQVRAANSQD